MVKLEYIGPAVKGWPVVLDGEDIRLWNLIQPGHPSHGSSLSLESLKQLGLIGPGGSK